MYKCYKIKKGHFHKVKNGRKTRFFGPKLSVSTKKRDILMLQDRKNRFLIIKYFFTPRANFFKAGFEIFAIKNLGIDSKIVFFLREKFFLGKCKIAIL